MALQSMTGFARSEGALGDARWTWELRSVNGKSLDIRMRLPQGFERYETEIRRACSAAFKRGNIQVSLAASGVSADVEPVLNERVLASVIAISQDIQNRFDADPPRLDGLLNIRNLIEFRDSEVDPEMLRAYDADCLEGLSQAVNSLAEMRETEGAALRAVLEGHVAAIEDVVRLVERDPSRTPEAIRQRLAEQVRQLVEAAPALDQSRLAMEAALLAAKADLREEIDRLHAHVAAARELLASGVPVGRRLDFLAQEFNRETNTICSKSNATSVTTAGLELKVLVDQFREQIQNLE